MESAFYVQCTFYVQYTCNIQYTFMFSAHFMLYLWFWNDRARFFFFYLSIRFRGALCPSSSRINFLSACLYLSHACPLSHPGWFNYPHNGWWIQSMQFLLRNFRKYSVSTSFSTLQASALRVATRRGLVVGYRRFRMWLSHLYFKMRPIGYPETSVTNCHPTPCNLPELRRSRSLEFPGLLLLTTCLIVELDADGAVWPGRCW